MPQPPSQGHGTHLTSDTSRPTRDTQTSAGVAEGDQINRVIRVLYHALQGVDTHTKYADDAKRAGDGELAHFFEECREEEAARARRAKALLVARMRGNDEDATSVARSEGEMGRG